MSEKSNHSGSSAPNRVSREHPAVRQANRRVDYLVAAIVTGICIVSGILIAAFGAYVSLYSDSYTGNDTLGDGSGSWFGWLFIAGAILVVILVTTKMMRQMYLGNALQVEYSDYGWLRDWSDIVAKDLKMPKVEIMITQDPQMNAFAFGFSRPYTIVLNSGSIRWLTHEQLKAVVVHEMAHVKYRHTQIGTYLSVLRTIPVVGGVFGWILDFWSRRIELTADRLALCYLRDVKLIKAALVRVHVGPDVADSFNDIAQQWQEYMTSNSLQSFTQTFSGHPFLVKRLKHLDEMHKLYAPTWAESCVDAATK